jgi:hypothetical protein
MYLTLVFTTLLFATFWLFYRTYCQYYYGKRTTHEKARKIGGNVTSITNGMIIIVSPLLITAIQYIIQNEDLSIEFIQNLILLNVAYLLVDVIDATLTFRLHHLVVFACDIVLYNLDEYHTTLAAMTIFSVVEMSNIFIWLYYHRIQYKETYPTDKELLVQLVWFGLLRTTAWIMSFWFAINYGVYSAFVLVSIVAGFSIIWGVGIFKKINKDKLVCPSLWSV